MARTAVRTQRVYVPVESFIANVDGQDITFIRDQTRVGEGHRILELFPDKFEVMRVHYDVEQATANPGETR